LYQVVLLSSLVNERIHV